MTLAERTPGAVVGRLSTVDADPDDAHVYALDDPRFEVAGDVLKLRDGVAVDYDDGPSIALQVTSTDRRGLSCTAAFTLAVLDLNRAPTAIFLDNLAVTERVPGAIVGLLSTSDPDIDDVHAYGVDDARFEIVETLLKLRDDVAVNYSDGEIINVVITSIDRRGLAVSGSFALTVLRESTTGLPPVAQDDGAITVANREVVINVLANDYDPDERTFSIVEIGSAQAGTVVTSGTASLLYTPNFGFVGRDSFRYTIANELGLEANATVTVDVEGDGESFDDGTYFTDGTGWRELAA